MNKVHGVGVIAAVCVLLLTACDPRVIPEDRGPGEDGGGGNGGGGNGGGGNGGASSSTSAGSGSGGGTGTSTGAAGGGGIPCGEFDCAGAFPICCWDPGNHIGTCARTHDVCSIYAIGCASAADCGSDQCCAGALHSECLPSCHSAGMLIFCAEESECPPAAGQDVTCEPTLEAGLPFSTGYCAYSR